MANNNSIAVGSIQKKDDLEIKGTLTTYKNELYVDIREYIKSADYDGPTKKGIRFHTENWDAFYNLMKKIDNEIKKHG